jgi:HKD family nuclease
MLQYWSKKESENLLPRWSSLPEHLRDCDDIELALIQTSRFTSLYMRKDSTLDLVDKYVAVYILLDPCADNI